VLIGALLKFASTLTELAPRAMLCLGKIVRFASELEPSVVQRASETLRLLKLPSVASALCSQLRRGAEPPLVSSLLSWELPVQEQLQQQ